MAPKKRKAQAGEAGQTTTGAYSANFEQVMNDQNMIFFRRNKVAEPPQNYDEIKKKLVEERPQDPEHPAHAVLDDLGDTPTHNDLVNCMLPILHEKKLQGPQNRQFTVMKPGDIIDANVKRFAPDYYEGAKANTVDKDLKKNLRTSIVPSNHNEDPIVPNFFLEFVTESRDAVVTRRQAGIDGVLGARCMNSLQNYPRQMADKGPPPPEWEFDGNAYSFGLTYRPRDLTIYSVHMTPPEPGDNMPGYRIAQIEIYSMVSEESYHRAISAYRNIRDLAKEYRDGIVTKANSRASQLRAPSVPRAPEPPASSEVGIVSSPQEGNTAKSVEDGDESTLAPESRSNSSGEPENEQEEIPSPVGSEGEQEDEQQDELREDASQLGADDPSMSFGLPDLDDPEDWSNRLRKRPRRPEEDANHGRPRIRRRRDGRGDRS